MMVDHSQGRKGGMSQEIFEKLKTKEDQRKKQCWYRVYAFTFHPNKHPRKAWDIFLMALVLYSAFVTPYRAVFDRTPGADKLHQNTEDWIIDALFYFDIVLNFFTGYDNGYQIETGKLQIAKKYLKGFFWVDLIATVQWDMIIAKITNYGAPVAWLALLKMMKVARMLRFGRLINRVTQPWKIHTGFVESGKFFIYVLYVAHVLACLFFLWSELFDCKRPTCVGTPTNSTCPGWSGTGDCPADCVEDGTTCVVSCDGRDGLGRARCPEGCQYTSYMANEWDLTTNAPLMEIRCLDGRQDELGCDVDESEVVEINQVALDERSDCVPTSWRHGYQSAGVTVNQMRPSSQWIQAFYWAITTMSTIGYGDRGPGNESEIVFTIAAELIGLAFFALLIQTINNLNAVIGLKEKEQREVKNKLVDQMRRNDLDDHLIDRVVKFLSFKSTSKAGRTFLREDDDFKVLSHALQRDVLIQANLPAVRDVKILGWSKEDEIEMDTVQQIFEDANVNDGGGGDQVQGLDRDEIRDLVLKLGVSEEEFTDKQLDDAMASMDSSGDDQVELKEFQHWWYTQRFERPRMKPCPESLLFDIAEHLEYIPASPGDIIVQKTRYGDSLFVLQAGVVIKRLPTNGFGSEDKPPSVAYDDNDPFFGLQAVLPDEDFDQVRPKLAMMEIVVAEDSYVECMCITREHLRCALGKVERLVEPHGLLDMSIRRYTNEIREANWPERWTEAEYQDDPAKAVINALKVRAKAHPQEKNALMIKKADIKRWRKAAWEWTDVNGKRMRGCEQLQQFAMDLTQAWTYTHDTAHGVSEEVRDLMGASQTNNVGAEAGDVQLNALTKKVNTLATTVDKLNGKVDQALEHAEHTRAILDALAKNQGLSLPPAPLPARDRRTSNSTDKNAIRRTAEKLGVAVPTNP